MTERYLKAEKCSCKERYPTYPGCGWRNSVRGWWRGGGSSTQTGKQRVSGSYRTSREEAPGPPRNAARRKGDACNDHGRALRWLPPGLPASSLGIVKQSGSRGGATGSARGRRRCVCAHRVSRVLDLHRARGRNEGHPCTCPGHVRTLHLEARKNRRGST